MNCLSHSLTWWSKHKEYNLFYNSNHVVAVDVNEIKGGKINWLQLNEFGLDYFMNFPINDYDKYLLKQYFKEKFNI